MKLHLSVPVENTMQFIDSVSISPLISKANIKVCYVGQEANRNHTVITKEVATEMGRKLPGSPVVGFFDKKKQDFAGHEREIVVEEGHFEIVDITRPYGFVPPNAEVWFQKFNDEGTVHEYLCTWCYLWTGAYPESKRVIESGNNQSMELDNEFSKGFWTKDGNSGDRIFIYNEALVEKLCLLGENVEPCFEGASVKPAAFSLENSPEFQEFKNKMFSMMVEIQETLNKGGSHMEENKDFEMQEQETPTPDNEFEKKKPENEEKKSEDTKAEDGDSKGDEEPEDDEKKKKKEDFACGGGSDGAADADKKKKKEYDLAEVTEYTELKAQYDDLQTRFSALEAEKASLDQEVASLREFKATTDRKSKQDMIDSFYMLSDEDKKDCVEHIDTYSLDDIEAKLSIICVRNKVNFNLEQDEGKHEENGANMFSLNNLSDDDNAPAWIKAVRQTANK